MPPDAVHRNGRCSGDNGVSPPPHPCAYHWPTLAACGNSRCLAAGECERLLELRHQARMERECERTRRRARRRRLRQELRPAYRRLGRLLRAYPRELRRLLLDLLAEDITDIAQAVAEEVYGARK